MNKMFVFASVLCSLLFCCEKHESKSVSEIRLCEFVTSPEILGVKRIKAEKKYYVFQVDANVEKLIDWVNSSPIGKAAFPHNERDEMRLSLTNSLRKKGDKLTLIHGTYSFNVDGKDQMAQIEVGLESKGGNVYKVQILMLPVQ